MWLKLQGWLRLDQSPNVEERRMRILLYLIGVLILAITSASWGVAVAVSYDFTVVIMSLGLVIGLGLMLLNWAGYLGLAKLLYPVLMMGFVVIVVWNGDGLYDESLLALPALIAMAGLLLRRRGVVIFTLLSVAIITVIGTVQLGSNWVEKYAGFYEPARVILLDFMVALSGTLIYLAIDNLVASIGRLRQNEQALSVQNQALEEMRVALEAQSSERARRAEAALLEAEQAHAALQAQIWQISGQEKLSEILRGEQNLEVLTDKVMSFLCRYIQAPLGAFFVYSENEVEIGWRFAGGFACRPGVQTPDFFKAGEGLVGQTALNRSLLSVEAAAGQVRISCGLGSVSPQCLLFLPLLHFDQVVGVIELAGLEPFRAEQIQFLKRSAESIAITLHNLHTRSRLQKLLDQAHRENRLQEVQP